MQQSHKFNRNAQLITWCCDFSLSLNVETTIDRFEHFVKRDLLRRKS